MPKKIFELAIELGMGALDLVEKLKAQGLNVRNHMATLSDEEVEKALSSLKVEADEEKKKTAGPTQKKAVKKAPAEKVAPKSQKTAKPNKAIKTVKTSGASDKDKELEATEGHVEAGRASLEEDRSELEAKKTEAGAGSAKKKSVIRRKAQDLPSHEREHEWEEESPSAGEEFVRTEYAPEHVERGEEFAATEFEEGHVEEEKERYEEHAPSLKEHTEAGPAQKNDFPELRGLQVIYRPAPTPISTPEKERKEELSAKEEEGPGRDKDNSKQKVYFEEKMHSFTPIYIPPKAPAKAPGFEKRADGSTDDGLTEQARKELREKEEENLKADTKKRMGGLAAMIAKPKAKVRDVIQLRADEELKTYNMALVGKSIYTPPGRKRSFSGATKETTHTEMKESKRVIQVHKGCTGNELAVKLSVKFEDLRDKCLEANLLLKPTDYLGVKLLSEITSLYGFRVENMAFDELKALERKPTKKGKASEDDTLQHRNPVVTIMGHVDHGKTTLLDYIRTTKVAAGEAGGITQHMGAYIVKVKDKSLTFIDTPGHAAFSSMRERGANVTDIVVLVVAADDGVMPQTRESIQICKAAGVPIIVAVNKMDKEGVNPDRIKQALMDYQLTPEEWGGDTQYTFISALKGDGVDKLLEAIAVQAEIMELTANPKGPAEGVVLEARLESGRGPMVTVLVKSGTLKQGDGIVVGECFGRVRSLFDATGAVIKEATPSTPVQILGLNATPSPGDKLNVVDSEKEAKKIVDNRVNERKELSVSSMKKKSTLEDFFANHTEDEDKKVLKLIVRSDVAGSYEAIKSALEKMGNQEVGVEVISGGTGAITDSDVQLAASAGGFILGFNMRPMTSAQRLAEEKGVDVKTYRIIYELIDDVKLALEGLLAPDQVEKYIGRAEVRDTFVIPKIGTIAGSAVIDGKIERGCHIRLLRDGKIVYDGKLSSLKRFKDDVKEVKNGLECGISLENFNNIQVRDIFEAYIYEQKKRTLAENTIS